MHELPVGLRQHVLELRMDFPFDDSQSFFGQDFRFVQILGVVLAKVDDDLR